MHQPSSTHSDRFDVQPAARSDWKTVCGFRSASPIPVTAASRFRLRLAFGASLALVYFCAAKIGLHFAVVNPSATAIWAPSGIALAACLLFGRWVWPAIMAGAFLTSITTTGWVGTSFAIAAGNTMEALFGAFLMRRYAGGFKVFDHTSDVFRFLLLVPLGCAPVAATIGVTSLCLGGSAAWPAYGAIWLTWWLGDSAGMLIVTPLLLLWSEASPLPWTRQGVIEAAALFLAVTVTGGLVFGARVSPATQRLLLAFLCQPVLLWFAFRRGPRETATAAFILTVMAAWGTVIGVGPFSHRHSNEALLLLQGFAALLSLTGVVVAIEVAERQRLTQSHARLAAIVESSNDAMFSTTLAGRITSWNAGAARIFGYSAAEAIGQSIAMMVPHEYVAREQEILTRLRRGELTSQFETLGRRKDGQLVEISLAILPISDRSGKITAASTVARDITQQKRITREREALLHSEQSARAEAEKALLMLRRLQMVTDVALSKVDEDEMMPTLLERLCGALNAEAAAILLLEPDRGELVTTCKLGFEDDGREGPGVRVPLGRGAAGRIALSDEGLIFDDLSLIEKFSPALTEIRSLMGAPMKIGGRVLGVINVGSRNPRQFTRDDLDLIHLVADRAASAIERARLHEQQRLAREAAEAANRAKDEFLAMLGHELRNPLQSISMAVRLLSDPRVTSDANTRARAIIGRQVTHVARLVDDLLDVARMTSGRIVLLRSPINLAATVAECVGALQATGEARQRVIRVLTEPAWVDGDPERLVQIVTNLLSNATKYTSENGTIEVTTRVQGEFAVLRVCDNGMGIAPDLMPRIFDLFARGAIGLDRSPGGLGIGLTMVKRLAEMHGGAVEAFSEGPGHGATFTVRLPRIAAPAADGTDAHAAASGTTTGHRILIVEDNTDARDSLRALLETLGHEVCDASDGPGGVASAIAHEPDVALIDIGLPGFDGYEVAARIRANPVCADTVLIAVTGYGQSEYQERAARAGFNGYLVKPIDPAELTTALSDLTQHRARKS